VKNGVIVRVANINGRLSLVVESGAIDVAKASEGLFPSDPQAVFDRWAEFCEWIPQMAESEFVSFDDSDLGAPAPRPRQVFAVGLNYRSHAEETDHELPQTPHIFTKFPSCITGQNAVVPLVSDSVDWEVELVLIVGSGGHAIGESDAWSHIAGMTVGQDVSERGILRNSRPWPQLCLGKSYPEFGPIGPYLVTPDEFQDPEDLSISCTVNGETMQDATTGEMIFNVPALISALSSVVALLPGDIIFTGTPSGIGFSQTPPRALKSGDVVLSSIEGIGTLRTIMS
jgi:2,4-diketo-3-deoxy-L-fuconate hydrolase